MKSSLILSTAVSLLATTPCYAVDWDSLVNTLLGSPTSGSISIGDQTQLKTVIANREAQIEQQIEAGARAGTLTSAEELELRNGLNNVERHEGMFLSDGTLTEQEARSLVDELSRLNLKVNAYLTNSTASGYAAVPDHHDRRYQHGNAYGYWTHHDRHDHDKQNDPAPNQAAVQAMIDSKQAELDSAISRGSLNGTLSRPDAQNLRVSLNQVATAERQAQADGVLSVREETDLTTKLNDIDTRLKASTHVAYRRGNWNHGRYTGNRNDTTSYRDYLHKRISNALAAGRISRDQANRLYAQERSITWLEARERKDGARYSYEEQRNVLSKLDQLAVSIDAAVGVGVR